MIASPKDHAARLATVERLAGLLPDATPTECEWVRGGRAVCLTRQKLHKAVVEATRMPSGPERTEAFERANAAYRAHACNEGWGLPDDTEAVREAMSASAPGGSVLQPTRSSGIPTLDSICAQIDKVVSLAIRAGMPDVQHEYLDERMKLRAMVEEFGRPRRRSIAAYLNEESPR